MITLNHSMIKELSLAIVLGLLIGFGLTGTYYYVKQSKNQQKNTPNIVIPTTTPENNNSLNQSSPTPSPSSLPELKINSPQNNDIVSTNKTTIKGQSNPNSLIIITTPLKNYHLSADVQGLFSQEVFLEAGFNSINITTIDENDRENHFELSITYSSVKIE